MKYCLNYANSSKKMIKEAEEINIIYNKNDIELPAFIEKHAEKRINLIIEHPEGNFDNFEIKKIQAIAEKYPEANIHICLYSLQKAAAMDNSIVAQMNSVMLPWFTGYIATTWDALHYLISLGVSDIYIAEDLGFELPKVSKICKKAGVAIRVIPNVAQSSINNAPDLKKFFIRPEDIDLYAEYIDTIEFWGELTQQDTFYKIYKTMKCWVGNLKEIIFSFNLDFDNHRILPEFGKARLNCGKGCLKGQPCSICNTIYDISKQMEKHDIIVVKRKKSSD